MPLIRQLSIPAQINKTERRKLTIDTRDSSTDLKKLVGPFTTRGDGATHNEKLSARTNFSEVMIGQLNDKK